jgi:hypothetical protein
VVVAPIATFLALGQRAASVSRPFHVVLKGKSYVFGEEDSIDSEAWFDGKKLRTTSHVAYGIDQIEWAENGAMWQSFKPDGVLKTEKAKMAKPENDPRELVYGGKYASAKFFELVLDQYAPKTPATSGQPESDADLPGFGRCSVERYRIKAHHVGIINRWQEDFNSDVFVYTSRGTGKIARIRQVVDEGNGKTATIEFDYDYSTIPSAEFDPNTLQPFSTRVPATKG